MSADRKAAPPLPERFRVAKATLLLDRAMTSLITVGGVVVVAAVLGIFVFILAQVLPLFRGAQVSEGASYELPAGDLAAFGIDEWGELPYFIGRDGAIWALDTSGAGGPHHRGSFAIETGLPDDLVVTAVAHAPIASRVLYGTADGRFTAVTLSHRATFPERGGREVKLDAEALPPIPIGREGVPIELIAYGDSGTRKLAAAVQRVDGRPELHAVTLDQGRSLFGEGEIEVRDRHDLSEHLAGEPAWLLIPEEANAVLVGDQRGDITYLFYQQGRFSVRQRFRPFDDLPDPSIGSMHYVLGDVSLLLTSASGEMRVFSLFRDEATSTRLFGQTKRFPSLDGPASFYAPSARNKAFLSGTGRKASLRYMTTEDVRWEAELPFEVRHALIGPRYDSLYFVDTASRLHRYDLHDPHPLGGWKTYFGKLQYEGQAEPSYEWQSTGGRDDFERKLSLVPVIIGTLKGTIYALLFAVPIALLAAIYTSQFLDPRIKRFVKPAMEIMASLPSVVLGFLAALWLAPIISNAVPSVLLAVVGLVGGAFLVGWSWHRLPAQARRHIRPGYEFLLVLPAILMCAWLGWTLGGLLEQALCRITDPETGHEIADFRLWFPVVTGLSFEQRNALVVGFVMGFAVIPIIFTIAEDAMSNVPEAFRSGSLALGASRWQTAMRVVLPTASAGIFSALMIGLGRAVGETMIVVMATGNVPVTELNPFTGMRTLSANIAVELPEAPYLGTLYRTLFLGALVLFLMTFLVNTVAEILRQHLRDKYKAIE
jgi:phosphate transport system permease protein